MPIAQAPIGSATTPELAAAVSNAGGLGTLALSWRTMKEVAEVVHTTSNLTRRPFAINLVLEWPQEERLRISLDAGVGIVSTFWGDPTPIVRLAHRVGAVVIHAVGSAEEAREAANGGVDVIVVQGVEAGGHVRGREKLRPLLASVRSAVGAVPVFAAGGIAAATDVDGLLADGADGVWVGTRFLCSDEAGVESAYRAAIIAAGADATVLTTLFNKGWEDAPHRVLVNSTFRAWRAAGEPPIGTRPGETDVVATDPQGRAVERYSDVIPVAGSHGDLEALALYAGEGVRAIGAVSPAGDIVAELATNIRSRKTSRGV